HIETVASTMKKLDVDLFNCMPYHPSAGSHFEHLEEPGPETVNAIRAAAEKHVRQMRHCTRCRSDAVGLLGEAQSEGLMAALKNCQHLETFEPGGRTVSTRPYVGVASQEGVLVNQHLGEASQVLVYGRKEDSIGLIEARKTPEPGSGMDRWKALAAMLSDCRALLVSGIGANPTMVLKASGIQVIECEGLIDEAVHAVYAGKDLRQLAVRRPLACGSGCGGNQMGCG
ncbi:MAG: NifB/NifX family molybdenum-iron cluster-binding protein, partial [Desulfosarcinaceae bacterium]